jgi:hypothetical protein
VRWTVVGDKRDPSARVLSNGGSGEVVGDKKHPSARVSSNGGGGDVMGGKRNPPSRVSSDGGSGEGGGGGRKQPPPSKMSMGACVQGWWKYVGAPLHPLMRHMEI